MPEFCLGMVTFHLWHRWLKEKRWHCLIWSSLELALLSVGWSWISHDYWVFMTGFRSSWFTYWLGMAGSCWLFAALIAVLAYGTGIVGRLLSVRPLVWAGKVSFALYMVHQIVFKIMVWRWDITSSRVLLPCVLAAAAIVHYVIERPSQRTIAGLDVRRARVIEFSDTR
jgi:peptidoglycan/LPS O-acetylase OafA/YrhL